MNVSQQHWLRASKKGESGEKARADEERWKKNNKGESGQREVRAEGKRAITGFLFKKTEQQDEHKNLGCVERDSEREREDIWENKKTKGVQKNAKTRIEGK